LDWNGILLEQYQSLSTPSEIELPALSDHWLTLHMGHPVHLTQNHDDRLHESIVQKGDSIFVPAGQPSYRCRRGDSSCSLHILLKPQLGVRLFPFRLNAVRCVDDSNFMKASGG
jgi:AraC family transcriptional regulator